MTECHLDGVSRCDGCQVRSASTCIMRLHQDPCNAELIMFNCFGFEQCGMDWVEEFQLVRLKLKKVDSEVFFT